MTEKKAATEAQSVAGEDVAGIDVRIAQELIEKARADGVSVVGPAGLLAQITKTVLQTASDTEMTEHLGYSKAIRRVAVGAITATAARQRRCTPRSALSGWRCPGIGWAVSARRSCPSTPAGWRASTRPSSPCMPRG